MNSLNEKALPAAQPLGQGHIRTARTITLPERCDVYAKIDLGVRFAKPEDALVLDGSRVTFVDMHTLQSWVDTRLKALDRGCDIVVDSPSDELRATLELTGFDALLPVLGIEPHSQPTPDVMVLSGVLGPSRLAEVESELFERLAGPRPRLELRLIDVETLHLGIANLLVTAQEFARKRGGDIDVFVDADSPAQRCLASVGIVGTMRP